MEQRMEKLCKDDTNEMYREEEFQFRANRVKEYVGEYWRCNLFSIFTMVVLKGYEDGTTYLS